MEIKKIEKNIANYPKKNEIEKSEIKKATPKKWIFSGMLLSVIDFVRGKVLAGEIPDNIFMSGAKTVDLEIPIVGILISIIQIISFTLLVAAIIEIIYTKIRAKIKKLEHKISKNQKIFMIISLVLVTLSFIAEIIYHLGEEITV